MDLESFLFLDLIEGEEERESAATALSELEEAVAELDIVADELESAADARDDARREYEDASEEYDRKRDDFESALENARGLSSTLSTYCDTSQIDLDISVYELKLDYYDE